MAFAFLGKHLNEVMLMPNIDFRVTEAVIVSSNLPNPGGHILLCVSGRPTTHYFHVAGHALMERPYFFAETDWPTYLTTGRRREVARRKIVIPRPDKARQRLEELMRRKSLYGLVVNNCVSFVEKVVQAGGNFWELPSNIPLLENQFGGYFEKVFGPEYCAVARRISEMPQAVGGTDCR